MQQNTYIQMSSTFQIPHSGGQHNDFCDCMTALKHFKAPLWQMTLKSTYWSNLKTYLLSFDGDKPENLPALSWWWQAFISQLALSSPYSPHDTLSWTPTTELEWHDTPVQRPKSLWPGCGRSAAERPHAHSAGEGRGQQRPLSSTQSS